MEPWEALDVDDSDLPSLLRPCKKLQRQATVTTTATVATAGAVATATSLCRPILTASSHLSQSHSSQNLFSSQNSQLSNYHRRNFDGQTISPSQSQPILDPCANSQPEDAAHSRQFDPALPAPDSLRLIPGPAGAVQAAMLRNKHNRSFLSCEDPHVTTQEYIWRTMEEPEEDMDFKSNPWLCAIEFLHQNGEEEGVVPCTPLCSIKKYRDRGKVDQILAVIKSCTPNGLGDLMVTLKDPTDSIGGSIHRKVLVECEISKDISVGSVLILQKVAIFSPSVAAHYLNITLNNVVKVIPRDSEPPLIPNYPVYTVKYATSRADCHETAIKLQTTFSLEQRTERTMAGLGQKFHERRNYPHNLDMERSFAESQIGVNASHINKSSDAVEEPLLLDRRNGTNHFSNNTNEWIQGDNNNSNSLLQSSDATILVKNHNDLETQSMNGVQKQRQKLISRESRPEWTDEELKELFDVGFTDDCSLF